ncbi:MAG: glycoside hydrolase family 88 protein [Phycisphaeraceae bacterium]|nr:glycoside hydrolase family 88 protein [Phycisphaeraceae bacterium]
MNRVRFVLISLVTLTLHITHASHAQNCFTPVGVTEMLKKVNTYIRENPYRPDDRNWIRATYYTGVLGAYEATKDPAYLEQTLAWAKKHQWQVGTEVSGSNRLFCAMTWAQLYLLDPDPEKIEPTLQWLTTDSPYSPGGAKVWYGHAPAPHDSPLYSDSLYGAPVFAMLYKATGDSKYLDIMNDFFWHVTDTILDKDEDLYYRDPTYMGKKSPNGKKLLWSRGNGWVFAAFPRIMRYLPKDNPFYERYVALYQRMAKALASCQHADGLWRSNLGDPDHYLMPETSGTAFFTYGFAWGINQGLLDRKVYVPVVAKAWHGLVGSVHPNGKLGWVQPVDAQPRPSLPVTTHEYAAGLFLLAGSEVLKLLRSDVVTPDIAGQYIPDNSTILPFGAVNKDSLKGTDHPLADKINIFLKRQQQTKTFTATGFSRNDYLDVIAGQVKAMQKYQDSAGRIIDPVTKEEMYFTTPCYAHSIAALTQAGYPISRALIESGMSALDVSLEALAKAEPAGNHGDFYTWPALFAYELFGSSASAQRKEQWSRLIAGIKPENSYRVFRKPYKAYEHGIFYNSFGKAWANNWNLVNTAGEYLRSLNGFTDLEYVDFCLTMQLPHFNPYGMYNEDGNPFPYDLFSRHYVTGMLHRGYRSFVYSTYRDLLWKGAWTSLFIQSPTGQLPTGYRSSHHIWNEAEQAVVFEIYASQYAQAGMMEQAGAFKRAAHLALSSVKNWIRPDGTGYIVKNKYPIEARHGYEGYSQHTCYNMLACSMLAQAWQFSDENVKEKPCPADVGGFAVTLPGFHKVFANAGGTYVEYDTSGDQKYNPTGLLRIHLKDGHAQLGPSDGCAANYSGKDNLFAVGPSWKDADGRWVKLAELTEKKPIVDILDSATDQVRFEVTYRLTDKKTGTLVHRTVQVKELFTIKHDEVLVENTVEGFGVSQLRVYYPMLVFDGANETDVQIDQNVVRLMLDGKGIQLEALQPSGVELVRSGKKLNHRNGIVELLYWDVDGTRAHYRITAIKER